MNQSDRRVANLDDLPLVLNPKDVAEVLGISRNKAYEIIHSSEFPVFRVGKQYRVSKKNFLTWLERAS